MNEIYKNCPALAAVNKGKPIRVSVETPITFSQEQAEVLFESACARSFQYGEVACISLLDLELILQKGVSKCESAKDKC
ncbi:MAG: hypothetical protein ACLRWF_03330 [Ruthenibacterium sp.]